MKNDITIYSTPSGEPSHFYELYKRLKEQEPIFIGIDWAKGSGTGAKMGDDIKHMAKFLPPITLIAKTPDHWAPTVKFETVELKTEDVIAAFVGLQREAVKEASKIRDGIHRESAIRRIMGMKYFSA